MSEEHPRSDEAKDTLDKETLELLGRSRNSNVFIKHRDKFFRMHDYFVRDGEIFIDFSREDWPTRNFTTVSVSDLKKWQDEGRLWLQEKSRIVDQYKEDEYKKILDAMPVIIGELNKLGAREITSEETLYQSERRTAVNSFEPDTRKRVYIRFCIGDEKYELSGEIETYSTIWSAHTWEMAKNGDNYKTSWFIKILASEDKEAVAVGCSLDCQSLLNHLKDWVGGERTFRDY
jgi:hypothetical protein